MAKNLYLGVDGTARRVRKMYFGAPTECPVYENQNVDTNITASNIKNFFSVTNGSYYFDGSGAVFTSNNQGEDSTTVQTVLTAKENMDVSFKYSYSSETNSDKFTLVFAGTTVENGASGYTTSKSYSGTLAAGQTISFTYTKDSSNSDYDDECTFSDMVVTTVKRTQVGTETKEAARKIKKVYVGVNGVARQFYSYSKKIIGFGHWSDLKLSQTSCQDSMGASVGNYALFAGGKDQDTSFSESEKVTAFDSSLTRSSATALSKKRCSGVGASFGNYALFAGGYYGVFGGYTEVSNVDVYDSSLTRTKATSLSVARCDLASAQTKKYVIFAGGDTNYNVANSSSGVVDAYNQSLTRSTITSLSSARHSIGGANVGNYAIFAGGYNDNTSTYHSTIDIYDNSLTKISSSLSLPAALSGVSGASVDGYAFFAGGYNGSSYSNSLSIINESLTLTTSNLTFSASGIAAASNGNNAGFAFGRTGSSKGTSSFYGVDSSGTCIAYGGGIGAASKYAVAAAAIGDYILFGGGYTGSDTDGSISYMKFVE